MGYQRFPPPEELRDVVEHAWLVGCAAGGTQVGEVQELPGIGRLCYVRDTEGVVVALRQRSSASPR